MRMQKREDLPWTVKEGSVINKSVAHPNRFCIGLAYTVLSSLPKRQSLMAYMRGQVTLHKPTKK